MKKAYQCPKCGHTINHDDLNETGLAMLKKKGPPGCCGAKMKETWGDR